MKRFCTGLACVCAANTGAALAQQDPSVFTTDEAARCAATYAFTLDAMQTASNVPRTVRNAMRDGLAIWEYELSRSAPAATSEDLQSVANRAVAYVRSEMPDGDGPQGAKARGDYLTDTATDCREKIVLAYQGTEHPVIPFLRQAEVTVGDAPSPVAAAPAAPKAVPVAASASGDPAMAEQVKPVKKGRGLR